MHSDRPALPAHLLETISVAVLSAALLTYAYIGFFTRYFGDDWCTAAALHSKGFVDAQRFFYVTINGRYAFRLAISIAEMAGPGLTPFLPFIILALWLAATVWTLSRLLPRIRGVHPWMTSLLLGELIIFSTLDNTPDVWESLYTLASMLTYIPPLILMTTYVGMVVRWCTRPSVTRVPAFWVTLSAVLAFLAGGFSETNLSLHITALLIAMVTCAALGTLRSRPGLLSVLGAGLAGSVLALAVVWAAPGNELRIGSQFAGQHPQFSVSLVGMALTHSFRFVHLAVVRAKLTTLLVVLLPMVLGVETGLARPSGDSSPTSGPRYFSGLWSLVFVPIVGFLLILSSVFPFIALGHGLPPGRTLIVAEFVFFAGTACWSYLAGRALSSTRLLRGDTRPPYVILASSLVIGLLLLSPIRHADSHLRGHLSLGPEQRAYASMWDRRDRQIRIAALRRETQLTVPTLDSVHFKDITRDPRLAWNRCMAEYYGLKSIQSEH